MSNTPGAAESDADVQSAGVLRPFVEADREPLPPVESPTLSEDTDELRADDLDNVWAEDALADTVSSYTDAPSEGDGVGDDGAAGGVVPDLDSPPTRSRAEILAEARWTLPADDTEHDEGVAAEARWTLPADDTEHDEGVAVEPEPAPGADDTLVVPPAPVEAAPADTVTLPRKAFLVGLGAVAVALVALVALWQTAGGDGDSDTTTAAEPAPDSAEGGDGEDAPPADAGGDQSPAAEAPAEPSDDGTGEQVEELSAEIEQLQQELAAQPAPSLPGVALERIVAAFDTKFVSAIPESVAVVGPFGDIGLVDPANNQVVGAGNIAQSATRVLRTPSAAWVSNFQGNEVLRVDPASFAVSSRFEFPGPDGLLADDGTLVIASYSGEFVARVDPSGQILEQIAVGGNPTAVALGADRSIWAAIYDSGELVRIDPATFEVAERVQVGSGPVGLTITDAGIWTANHESDMITLVDPTTAEVVEEVVVGSGPTELVGAWGSLWVTVTDEGDLVEVDEESFAVLTRTPLGGTGVNGGPTGITASDDDLWIAMLGERSIVRVRRAEIE